MLLRSGKLWHVGGDGEACGGFFGNSGKALISVNVNIYFANHREIEELLNAATSM